MRALAEAFPHLHETLNAHTRVHTVAPSVALDLRDDWLQMRVFARSGRVPWNPSAPLGDDGVLFELSPERGWVRAERAARRRAGVRRSRRGHRRAAGGQRRRARRAAGGPERRGVDRAPRPRCGGAAHRLGARAAADQRGACRRAGQCRARLVDARRAPVARSASARPGSERPPGVVFFGTDRDAPPARRRPHRRAAPAGARQRRRLARRVGRLGGGGAAPRPRPISPRCAPRATPFVKLDSGWVRARSGRGARRRRRRCSPTSASIRTTASSALSVWQLAGASPATARARSRHLGGDAETLAALRRLRERIAAFTGIRRPCRCRPGSPPSCAPTSATASTSSPTPRGSGSARCSPTTWASARRCRRWPGCCTCASTIRDGGPALVVCPASVVHNWAREAARFAPELRVLLLTSGKDRHALREEIPAARPGGHDLRAAAPRHRGLEGACRCAPRSSTRRSSSRIPTRR